MAAGSKQSVIIPSYNMRIQLGPLLTVGFSKYLVHFEWALFPFSGSSPRICA